MNHERRLTAEEFARLPEAERGELVDGRVVERHVGGIRHGRVDFILSRQPDRVRRPDVAWVRAGRIAPTADGFVEGAPDLAVEVLSPNDSASEIEERVHDFLAAGTRLVWVVNPFGRYVIAHAADAPPRLYPAGAALDGGDVLPGFSCPVSELFPE
jgi:Uma2 family endonuclease